MHLRISTLLCCAILTGFANSSQSSTDRTYKYNDAIDIDADLEGSGGGGKEVSRDLVEASGSGHGPSPYDDDDEDHNHVEVVKKITPVETTQVPVQKISNQDIVSKSQDFENRKLHNSGGSGVSIMNSKLDDRPPFFNQPGILAAVIGGAVVGLLCAILVVMFIVYRMRKKDEGSYALDEPKRSPTSNSYSKGNNREFYA